MNVAHPTASDFSHLRHWNPGNSCLVSTLNPKVASVAIYIFTFIAVWLTFKSFKAQFFDALHTKDQFKYTLLVFMFAIWNKKALITPDASQESPLHIAVKNDDLQASQLLIRAGAEWTIVDKRGQTPLDLAYAEGKDAVVIFLLQNGAPGGQELVLRAYNEGKFDLAARMILEGGVNPNIRIGKTSLLYQAYLDAQQIKISSPLQRSFEFITSEALRSLDLDDPVPSQPDPVQPIVKKPSKKEDIQKIRETYERDLAQLSAKEVIEKPILTITRPDIFMELLTNHPDKLQELVCLCPVGSPHLFMMIANCHKDSVFFFLSAVQYDEEKLTHTIDILLTLFNDPQNTPERQQVYESFLIQIADRGRESLIARRLQEQPFKFLEAFAQFPTLPKVQKKAEALLEDANKLSSEDEEMNAYLDDLSYQMEKNELAAYKNEQGEEIESFDFEDVEPDFGVHSINELAELERSETPEVEQDLWANILDELEELESSEPEEAYHDQIEWDSEYNPKLRFMQRLIAAGAAYPNEIKHDDLVFRVIFDMHQPR